LGSFLFSNDDIDKKVSVLSGGEKARLALAKLLLEPYNVLLLDEPTNHLDMASKDVLKNALLRYNGTLIIVSHDRDFLQGLTDKVFEFRNKTVKVHLGDIQDYLDKTNLQSLELLNTKTSDLQSTTTDSESDFKMQWEKQKQKDSSIRKLEKQIEKIENEIQTKEKLLEELNSKLCTPEHYAEEVNSGSLYNQYQSLQKEIAVLVEKWEKSSLEREAMKE